MAQRALGMAPRRMFRVPQSHAELGGVGLREQRQHGGEVIEGIDLDANMSEESLG